MDGTTPGFDEATVELPKVEQLKGWMWLAKREVPTRS